LLYRWGNPAAYRRGTPGDQRFFGQHDAHWIPEGLAGAGRLLVFNNGAGRPGADRSSVVEIEPTVDTSGAYLLDARGRFGPDRPVREVAAADGRPFFGEFLSSAQRLPDGHTLICVGPQGRLLEIDANGNVLWRYDNPYAGDASNPHGDPPYSVFRATYVPADHPGLAGRRLRPLEPQPPRQRSAHASGTR
jgi:hypothetical protein